MFTVSKPMPAPAAGQLYRTPAGKLRLLVTTTDGREGVINPSNGRLLTHGKTASGKPRVFTTWAERIAEDGYEYVGNLTAAE